MLEEHEGWARDNRGMDLKGGSDGPEMPQREGHYSIEVDECLDAHTPP